ncbi:hypothetical protein V8G54_007818 [Vigna mungo]|uniref:Retrotransposon Copia-like N-terminal domain-containing protein n=1 Tax=Vigna mungo TaxID=3915 RepID=A0AAQ3P422_VIGMU
MAVIIHRSASKMNRLVLAFHVVLCLISFFDHLSNPVHPLFLHPGENPTLILVNPPLSDTNFQQWRHDMLVALETKNKDKFVLGTLSCPPPDDVLHEAWKRCNEMVISWLMHSMTLPIKQYLIWMDSAYEIWTDLLPCFSHCDKFCIVDLREELQSCKQDYVNGMGPMSALPKPFSLVLQEEGEFHNSSSQTPQDSMANLNFQDPQNKTSNTSRGGSFVARGRGCTNKFGGRAKYCDNYQRTNHTSNNCWIKYGLPQGYKPTIKHNFVPSNPSANLIDVVSHACNDSSIASDKAQVQCSFSGLLKQSQPSTTIMANINQCTPQSSGSSSTPKFSSWIIDSGATNHICSSRLIFNSL